MEKFIEQKYKLYSYQAEDPKTEFPARVIIGAIKRLMVFPYLLLMGVYLILFVRSCKYSAFTAMMWDNAVLFWKNDNDR